MKEKLNWRVFLGLLLVSGFLWWSDGRGWWKWLRSPIDKLVQPVRHKLYISSQKLWGRAELLDEGWQSYGEQSIMEAEIVRLKKENEELRKLLGAPLPANWQFIPGKILQKLNDKLIIGIGSEAGVKMNDLVMGLVKVENTETGWLIGKIGKIKARQSQVQLLTDENIVIKARTKMGIEGIVEAEEGKLLMKNVLQEKNLNKGGLVLTKGGDGWLADLVVGKINKIIKVESAVYQQIEVKGLTELESLEQVFVVR